MNKWSSKRSLNDFFSLFRSWCAKRGLFDAFKVKKCISQTIKLFATRRLCRLKSSNLTAIFAAQGKVHPILAAVWCIMSLCCPAYKQKKAELEKETRSKEVTIQICYFWILNLQNLIDVFICIVDVWVKKSHEFLVHNARNSESTS